MQQWNTLLLTFVIGLFLINSPASARFYSNDPVQAQAHLQKNNIHGFNRYAYANNNPFKFVDPDGRNPKLLVDFGLNVALNVATTGEMSLVLAAKETVSGALNPAKSVQTAQKLYKAFKANNKVGSYTITFKNGKTYDGKGPIARMEHSMRDKATENNGVQSADWKPAADHRAAFKDEHKRMTDKYGKEGHNQDNSLNKIASPGKKYNEQDGSN